MTNDRSTVNEFTNQSKILSLPGELSDSTSLDFAFPNVEKPYESYLGTNVKLRLIGDFSNQKKKRRTFFPV